MDLVYKLIRFSLTIILENGIDYPAELSANYHPDVIRNGFSGYLLSHHQTNQEED
jgi:hypothetical protein